MAGRMERGPRAPLLASCRRNADFASGLALDAGNVPEWFGDARCARHAAGCLGRIAGGSSSCRPDESGASRALLTQFAGGAAGVIETEGVDAPTAENLDPRFGCCVFALQGKGFDARFIVDNGLFEHWVPPHRPELPAVAPRETALSREHVLLDVILDFGGATLADAQHLQVGDVLVSSTPIDSLFHLVLPDSRRLIAANLVRRGDRRAVQIDASSTTRKGS
jgi:hypothetical protein